MKHFFGAILKSKTWPRKLPQFGAFDSGSFMDPTLEKDFCDEANDFSKQNYYDTATQAKTP